MIEQRKDGPVLRATHGMCPDCLRVVPAEIREDGGRIWLAGTCPAHGLRRTLLSEHPAYYRDLHDFYFDVMRQSHPQRDYILRLTERCNLDCPICLAGANEAVLADYALEDIRRLMRRFRGRKFDLMGCEPTVMENLPEIVRLIAESGNIPALHSNGVALADAQYVRRLKRAGLAEVHLQFDGFDDAVYRRIRGAPLLETKMKALENLERLNVPVDLVMTILAGVNEKEILPVLEYGVRHANVKEVFFLGCRMLGRAVGRFESSQLLPDQAIDLLEEATGGRIARESVRRFQKLYFAMLSVFGVRKCLYIQHYLLLRNKDGSYRRIDEVLDLQRLERALERFRRRRARGRRRAVPLLVAEALPRLVSWKAIGLCVDFAALALMMALGFDLQRARRRTLMLGYITACDPLIYDTGIAENCGKGEISRDLGIQEAGALANVLREHRWRAQP